MSRRIVEFVDVHLDIVHPFDSDLLIELVSPTGKAVTLVDSVGMWGDDFVGTFASLKAAPETT